MKVALFVTCLNPTMFPSSGQAAVRLLRRLGVDVGIAETGTLVLDHTEGQGSATVDIELQRVEGVHGPRTLRVVLVEAATI